MSTPVRVIVITLASALIAVLSLLLWQAGGGLVLAEAAGLAAAMICIILIGRRVLYPLATKEETLNAVATVCADDPAACLLCDFDGKVVRLNRAAHNLLSADFQPSQLADLELPDTDTEPSAPRLLSRAHAGQTVRGDVQIRLPTHPEGIWLRILVRPLPDDLLLWRLEDITASRLITQSLASERRYYADFLDMLPLPTFEAREDGRITYANPAFSALVGQPSANIIDMPLIDLMSIHSEPDSAAPKTITVNPGQVAEKASWLFEAHLNDIDGTLTRGVLIPLPELAEHHNTAPTLAVSRLLEQATLVAPMGVAITDQQGHILSHNAIVPQLRGSSTTSLVDTNICDLVAPLHTNRLQNGLADPAEPIEVQLADSNATDVTVHIQVLSPNDHHSPRALYFIDTSAQRNLEAQFAQAQKMQAMGQLAGGVAHDFNNLLTAIIGFCDLLLGRHVAGDPSFADIMQIKQNANRAANLVRQLLAFSRKQPLQPKRLNVTDALSELSHLLNRLLGETIELSLIHGRDVGAVQVDPGQFDQVIINLAVNARDAMGTAGNLTITTSVETLDSPSHVGAEQIAPGDFVRVRVTDTGKGIAREDLGRIFEPFFSTKVEVPGAGTGLGLSTVYGIVRQTGGFIRVDSIVGEGTTFDVFLPRMDGTVQAEPVPSVNEPPEPPVPAAPAAAATILLTEDEDAVRVFAARALRNRGHEIIEARSGEGAVDLLQEHPDIDLLITDMMMPGMDGATLAKLARAERPDLRVILISGYSEEVARGEVLGEEDITFLPKPFSLSQLATAVEDVLRKRPASAPSEQPHPSP